MEDFQCFACGRRSRGEAIVIEEDMIEVVRSSHARSEAVLPSGRA